MRWWIPLLVVFSIGCSSKKPPPPPPIVKPVFFDSGSLSFAKPEEDRAVVDRVVSILGSTQFSLVIVGLADSQGDPASNKVLAQQRADHVAAMVKEKAGGAASRIKTHALGEQLADGVALSERKVEFLFYRDNGQSVQQVVENARALKDDRMDKAKSKGK